MFYVGDLSTQDANVLCRLCRNAGSILEFGVGASTQVFAQAAPAFARIISVETSPDWIARVRAILDLLDQGARVEFLTYEEWLHAIGAGRRMTFDLILDDGIDELRADFAEKAWPLLKIGGSMAFHDTRRAHDFRTAARLCEQRYLEVGTMRVNAYSSNLTVITKKLPEPYVDWNAVERRPGVAAGYDTLETTLAYVREQVALSGRADPGSADR